MSSKRGIIISTETEWFKGHTWRSSVLENFPWYNISTLFALKPVYAEKLRMHNQGIFNWNYLIWNCKYHTSNIVQNSSWRFFVDRQLTRLENKMNSDISMILHILQSHNAGRGYHGDGATTPMSDHPPPNYSHVNSPSDSEEKFSHSQSLHRQDRVVSIQLC